VAFHETQGYPLGGAGGTYCGIIRCVKRFLRWPYNRIMPLSILLCEIVYIVHRPRIAWPVPVVLLVVWLFFVGLDIQYFFRYRSYRRQCAEWQKASADNRS